MSRSVHSQRGFSVAEVAIALSVITVLLTAALGGVRAHQVTVALEMRTFEASCAASNQLEMLRAGRGDLTPGTRSFTPSMKGGVGTQTVEEIDSGLVSVEVVVEHASAGVRVDLHTLIARRTEP